MWTWFSSKCSNYIMWSICPNVQQGQHFRLIDFNSSWYWDGEHWARVCNHNSTKRFTFAGSSTHTKLRNKQIVRVKRWGLGYNYYHRNRFRFENEETTRKHPKRKTILANLIALTCGHSMKLLRLGSRYISINAIRKYV